MCAKFQTLHTHTSSDPVCTHCVGVSHKGECICVRLCAKWTFDFTGCCFLPVFLLPLGGRGMSEKKIVVGGLLEGWGKGSSEPQGFGVHIQPFECFFSSFWAFEFCFSGLFPILFSFFFWFFFWPNVCLLSCFDFSPKPLGQVGLLFGTVSPPEQNRTEQNIQRWSITAIYLTAGQVRHIPTEIRLRHADVERFIMAKIMMPLPGSNLARRGRASESEL